MPTTLRRTNVTHTPRVAKAMNAAAARWPEKKTSEQMILLMEAGAKAIATLDDDQVTASLNAVADQTSPSKSYNFGHELISNGQWEW